jgi:hypothetical protein
MEKLNIEALLDKNPQVDREKIRARLGKIIKEGPLKSKPARPISPYTGRRVTTDDKMEWSYARRLPARKS